MRSREFTHAVLLDPIQPFFNATQSHVRQGLEVADHCIVAILGHLRSRSILNPFVSPEKEALVRAGLTPEENARVTCIYVRDSLYGHTDWVATVRSKVRQITRQTNDSLKVCKVGDNYLTNFPQWPYRGQNRHGANKITAEMIRNAFFSGTQRASTGSLNPSAQKALDRILLKEIPAGTAELLKEFSSPLSASSEFSVLQEEWFFIDNYLKPYRHLRYTPTFQTGDAVVYQSDHVLLIRRGGFPAKGLLALPGGFIKDDETAIQAIYRELKEETKLKVPPKQLIKSLVRTERFDHPLRSVRRRTITEAGLFLLDDGHDLPMVKAADDAAEVLWMPVDELDENQHLFAEDHYFIIQRMIRSIDRKDDAQRSLMAALAESSMEVDL